MVNNVEEDITPIEFENKLMQAVQHIQEACLIFQELKLEQQAGFFADNAMKLVTQIQELKSENNNKFDNKIDQVNDIDRADILSKIDLIKNGLLNETKTNS